MSSWSALQSLVDSAMGSDFLVGAGVVLGSCILFIFKSVRNAGKGLLAGVAEKVGNMGARTQHIYDVQANSLNEGVAHSLFHIGVLTGAARVSVWQFHNGETFTLSKPVFKLRSSFEYDRMGLKPDCTVINDVLVTQCLPLVGPLLDRSQTNAAGVSEVTIDRTELPDGDAHRILKMDLNELSYGAFRYLMESLGTRTIYAVLMTTVTGSPFGIITMQFDESDAPENTLEPNATKICPLLSKIRFALDNTRH